MKLNLPNLKKLKLPNINWKKYRTPLLISIGLVILPTLYFYVDNLLSDFYLLDIDVHDEMDNVVPNDRIKLKLEYTKIRLQILSSVVVIIGIIVAFWRASIADKTANAVLNQVKIAQDGQITDRFTKAIEQLGNENMEVRLGAIYALERIAIESPKDHNSIMKIFASYIRKNSKVEDYIKYNIMNTKEDIHTIASVFRPSINLKYIDLADCYLNKVDLNDIVLYMARLVNTKLQSAKLYNADLPFADLEGADLTKASLTKASLLNANLRSAKLQEASLREADLQYTWLNGANLQGANLSFANLKDVDLEKANFEKAVLYKVDLTGAKNITFEQLIECKYLYKTEGIPPDIEERLIKEKPCLFTEEGCP